MYEIYQSGRLCLVWYFFAMSCQVCFSLVLTHMVLMCLGVYELEMTRLKWSRHVVSCLVCYGLPLSSDCSTAACGQFWWSYTSQLSVPSMSMHIICHISCICMSQHQMIFTISDFSNKYQVTLFFKVFLDIGNFDFILLRRYRHIKAY